MAACFQDLLGMRERRLAGLDREHAGNLCTRSSSLLGPRVGGHACCGPCRVDEICCGSVEASCVPAQSRAVMSSHRRRFVLEGAARRAGAPLVCRQMLTATRQFVGLDCAAQVASAATFQRSRFLETLPLLVASTSQRAWLDAGHAPTRPHRERFASTERPSVRESTRERGPRDGLAGRWRARAVEGSRGRRFSAGTVRSRGTERERWSALRIRHSFVHLVQLESFSSCAPRCDLVRHTHTHIPMRVSFFGSYASVLCVFHTLCQSPPWSDRRQLSP